MYQRYVSMNDTDVFNRPPVLGRAFPATVYCTKDSDIS